MVEQQTNNLLYVYTFMCNQYLVWCGTCLTPVLFLFVPLFQYCRHQNRKMLQDLLYQEDNQLELANCKMIDSYDEEVFVHLTSSCDLKTLNFAHEQVEHFA